MFALGFEVSRLLRFGVKEAFRLLGLKVFGI